VLLWNQYEFIECLGVLPDVTDEYEPCHAFKVEKEGLRLEVCVFEDAGDVYLDLYREGVESPVFSARLVDCEGARYVVGKGADYLEFAPPTSYGARYDGASPMPYGVRVGVSPHIRIELFSW
jgi:hypothetical protein